MPFKDGNGAIEGGLARCKGCVTIAHANGTRQPVRHLLHFIATAPLTDQRRTRTKAPRTRAPLDLLWATAGTLLVPFVRVHCVREVCG